MTLIRQLWYLLSRQERIEGSILLCGLGVGALLEAVSISLVVPFIAVLKEPGLVLDAPLAQPLLTLLNIRDPQVLLIALGLGLITAFVVKSGYLLLLYNWLYRYVFAKQVALTRQLLSGYLSTPYTFHLQRNSAELIKVTTGTIQGFTTGFLVSLLTILGEVFVVLALVILLVLVSPLATLGAGLVLGIPAVISYRAMQHRLAAYGRLAQQSMGAMIQWTEQAIGGIKETIVMDRAAFFVEHQGQEARLFAGAQRSMMFLSGIPRLVMDTLAVTAMVAIALVFLVREQDMESLLPVLGMFAVAAIRLMPSTSRVAGGLAQLRFLHATADVLYDELRAIDAAKEPTPARGTETVLPFERSLVLEGVSYRYPEMRQAAIEEVSLEVPRGHWVGIIGPTGAGKTTLVDLLLGLFVPTSGRILVDGRDIQDHLSGWQRKIGYVPQDVYLMDDTIRRNVAFGLPDEAIDDDRVWKALRSAQVDALVASLPDQLDAVTGERGERLSGGERQRLGIARSLYHDPYVLVVDEGTASLDDETEAAIVQTLARLRGEKTIIVIAHRLSVVSDCDRVYLLRQGRLRNSGTLSELLESDLRSAGVVGIAC